MASITPTYTYPFDPEGTKSTNLIQGERIPISAPSWSDFYFIIPAATPFFRNSLQVIHHPSGKILAEGVDYTCTHRFHDASLACGKPIYGSITFYDKTLTGVVELKYQTLGGAWTVDEATILKILSDTQLNPRITTWEQVTDQPFEFPVIDHQWDLVDLVGASEVVASLDAIKDAILASGDAGLAEHLVDYNNPHRVTKDQVLLGNVQNYGIADLPTAVAGLDNASYMTPLRTAQAIKAQAVNGLNAHLSDFGNPHQVTKDQVLLGLVQNFGVAGQTDAQAGTRNDLYMTPLRTSQAIAALALGPLQAHLADTNNPHQVTKAQVQLGLVQNFGIAGLTDAQAGTRNDLYMTPLGVRQAIASQLGADLTNHINDTNNPHQVTKAQVQLGNVQNYGIATQPQAEAGQLDNVYMTPLKVAQAIQILVKNDLTNHVNDTGNPHQVTQGQVGLGNVANYPIATSAQATAGSNDASYMTPLKVAQAIQALAGSGAAEGLAAHIADQTNPHKVTALQVGAYTTAQVDAAITTALDTKLDKTGKAADTNLFRGLTPAQIVAGVQARYYVGPVNASQQVDDQGNPITVNDGITWSLVSAYTPPTTIDPENPPKDIIFVITGGGPRYGTRDSVYKVHMPVQGYAGLTVVCLEGDPTTMQFGYSIDATSNQMRLWTKNLPHRNAMYLSVISDPGDGFSDGAVVEDAEPAGIKYAFTRDDRVSTQGASAGEIYFGHSAAQVGPGEAGPLVEFVNVAETTNDETACQAVLGNMKTDYRSFRPTSALGPLNRNASAQDLTGFSWDDTNGKVLTSVNVPTTRTTLLSPRGGMVNYTFEVELSSTNAAAQALGVCVAHVRRQDKDFGIYALRTPGGLVLQSKAKQLPGGDIYGLLTVGVNLLEDSAISLINTNTGLKWGDGVIDSGRAAAGDYVPAGHGWDTAGPIRMRVTRVGDTITIQTTQHSDTDYTAGVSVTVDLTSKPELAIFRGPTSWGLCAFGQASAGYKVLSRPDAYVPYVAYRVGTDGSDASLFNRYTGDHWDSENLTLAGRNARPGRLYYSAYSSKLFFVLPDGTLTPMNLETFASGGDHTVLTV